MDKVRGRWLKLAEDSRVGSSATGLGGFPTRRGRKQKRVVRVHCTDKKTTWGSSRNVVLCMLGTNTYQVRCHIGRLFDVMTISVLIVARGRPVQIPSPLLLGLVAGIILEDSWQFLQHQDSPQPHIGPLYQGTSYIALPFCPIPDSILAQFTQKLLINFPSWDPDVCVS